jgi:hypothetical protein
VPRPASHYDSFRVASRDLSQLGQPCLVGEAYASRTVLAYERCSVFLTKFMSRVLPSLLVPSRSCSYLTPSQVGLFSRFNRASERNASSDRGGLFSRFNRVPLGVTRRSASRGSLSYRDVSSRSYAFRLPSSSSPLRLTSERLQARGVLSRFMRYRVH